MCPRTRVGVLYAQHANRVQRLVAGHAGGDVEDACQVAWERLIIHGEVDLDGRGVVNWLVITAAREAWKRTARELPLSILQTDAGEHGEPVELAGDAPDPLSVVIDRDEARRRLARLTDREREFLALQALGLSYSEIAQATGTSTRTVERQLLRARRKLRPVGEEPGVITTGAVALTGHEDSGDHLSRAAGGQRD